MAVAARPKLVRAVVVPDELSLTMWGQDPLSLGVKPTIAPGRAQRLVVAEPLPPQLASAFHDLRKDVPPGAAAQTVPAPLPARPEEHHDQKHHHDIEHHDGGHLEGHDHGDMMAIVGEPSSDGLLMEPIELQYGPLATALPGGLVLEVELDGDVVSRCTVEATLKIVPAPAPRRPLDPLTPVGWSALLDAVTEAAGGVEVAASTGWARLAAVEAERALSHAAWLRSLGRVLGWEAFVEQCQAAVSALLVARPQLPGGSGPVLAPPADQLGRAAPLLRGLWETVRDSTALRWRLSGRGRVPLLDAPGLQGPNARALGQPRDARSHDPLYADLRFRPVLEDAGDSLARTRVRAREALQAVELALAALERARRGSHPDPPAPEPTTPVSVEGPRGPLVAMQGEHGLKLTAPGTEAGLSAAGHAALEQEWSAALVSVASFDLSPWRVTT